MLKYIFIILGTISLGLGLLGIVTPGLPTTPFILLTGVLYAKASPKLYAKLESNKLTGRYLKKMSGGLSLKARLISITFMWCMISFTAFVVFEDIRMRYLLLALGVMGTISQLIFLRKKAVKVKPDQDIDKTND